MANRRGNNEGTIRRRADGRWEGRVTLADGSQKYYYGKKRADVQKDLIAPLKKRQDGLPIMRNEMLTLGEFLKSWLDTAVKGRVRPLTYRYYKQKIEGHILPGLGRVRLVQPTTPRIQGFLNERHEAGLSPKTVKHLRDSSELRSMTRTNGATSSAIRRTGPTCRGCRNTALSR